MSWKAGYLIAFFVLLYKSPIWAADRPALGERQYLLKGDLPYAPAEIRPLAREPKVPGLTIMKDPIPLNGRPRLVPKMSEAVPVVRPKRISRMSFDQVAVKGRYLVPRVSFERPVLEVERSEEAIPQDYRAKIKESESLLRELDW